MPKLRIANGSDGMLDILFVGLCCCLLVITVGFMEMCEKLGDRK